MTTIEVEDKKKSNELTTSTTILNEKEKEEEKDKSEKITLEDLANIISEPDEKEQDTDKENEHEHEHIHEEKQEKKESSHLSNDEMLESELRMIKKQKLNKNLMKDNKFNSTESEEEISNNSNIIKPKRFKLYKFVGRTLFVFLDRYENPLIIIGPHWPMYICFCGIISFLFLVVYLTLWKQIGLLMQILGHICFWTYFISYSYCSLCNPGYPKNDIGRKIGQPREEYYFCNYCRFYLRKSRYANHCFDCDICIENQDHHCPWTGHCIGRNNYYSFFIFVGSSFVIIIYLAAAISIGASKYN